MPTIDVEDIGGFRCRTSGGGDRSILWVHGLGESSLCFEHLLSAAPLAEFRHIAPDLRGYGRALWPSAPRKLDQHAQELIGLLEQLAAPTTLIGHSMGGVIGQLLCEEVARKQQATGGGAVQLQGFVNLEGNLSMGDCGYSGKAAPYALDEFCARGFDTLRSEIFTLGVEDPAHRTYHASCCLSQPATFHLNSTELVELSRTEGLAQRFADLELRRAFVQGVPSGAPPRSAELLRNAGIEPKTFEPAGHWPFIDQADAFLDWLCDWLSIA